MPRDAKGFFLDIWTVRSWVSIWEVDFPQLQVPLLWRAPNSHSAQPQKHSHHPHGPGKPSSGSRCSPPPGPEGHRQPRPFLPMSCQVGDVFSLFPHPRRACIPCPPPAHEFSLLSPLGPSQHKNTLSFSFSLPFFLTSCLPACLPACSTWKFPGQESKWSCRWSLHHSHSNVGSDLHLRPTQQLTEMPDPSPTIEARD